MPHANKKKEEERSPFCRKCYTKTMKRQYLLGFEPPVLGVTNKDVKFKESHLYDWVCERCGFRALYGSIISSRHPGEV